MNQKLYDIALKASLDYHLVEYNRDDPKWTYDRIASDNFGDKPDDPDLHEQVWCRFEDMTLEQLTLSIDQDIEDRVSQYEQAINYVNGMGQEPPKVMIVSFKFEMYEGQTIKDVQSWADATISVMNRTNVYSKSLPVRVSVYGIVPAS